ncbi:unnamed protein product [Pleuronectes platessa]|uniref:Uncharacterized protein n=1 Tax=Pleuronectes platessa TaxID=8262 RepID=A0A9N7VHM8_PLEPL|nr:unnamed protein product [Pleuronectes platessa]
MPPFHGCPLCTDLSIVRSSLAPFAAHTRPAGTEMAAPLTRSTIPPPVHTTIEGHEHRHLYGTQEAEEGNRGLTGRWCCQRLCDVSVAFTADKGLAERFLLLKSTLFMGDSRG